MFDPETSAELRYLREGDAIRVVVNGMTNDEFTSVLIGFWLRLAPEAAAAMLAELLHYVRAEDPELPPLSLLVGRGDVDPGPHLVVDLLKHREEEHGERDR